MNRLIYLALIAVTAAPAFAAAPATKPATTPATKPALKIIPGQVIVPFDNMRRPWGELISIDFANRTGKFRKDGTDEVIRFIVLPYAELLHHAASGDLEDFRIGERAIFRLHPNEAGEWIWLTYIQDEMNMMLGHKEFFHVDSIDKDHHSLTVTQANQDKSYVREKGIVIETDGQTHFWKNGQSATFEDIKPGDALRTKTHGVGKGKSRVAWEVFLDEESLLKFQVEQKAVHAARMLKDGAPAYVDEAGGQQMKLTMFQEGSEQVAKLTAGKRIQISPAGPDRKAARPAIEGTVVAATKAGRLNKLTVTVASTDAFKPGVVARVWPASEAAKLAK
jgi:hypothetical protein